MTLIAQKPCSFGGNKYFVGDEIPVEFVENPKKQEKMGVLTILNKDGEVLRTIHEAADMIRPFPGALDNMQVSVPIESENGTQALSVAPGSVAEALRIMQMDVKDAEKVIENLDDEYALIILHACDSRKGIKNASEKKALLIQHPEEEEFEDEVSQINLGDLEEGAGDE